MSNLPEEIARSLPVFVPHRDFLVEYHGGPLDGRTLPVYSRILDEPGWRHGIPSRGETGNGGVIWAHAHRWPVDCPRYVMTVEPGRLSAEWRGITAAEFDRGEFDEATWRAWQKVLHPFPYHGDTLFFARRAAERKGVDDPATLRLVAGQAVAAARKVLSGQDSYLAGDHIPTEVTYVCDVRGNMQVRVEPDRSKWFQPAPDAYTCYPDGYVWVPPIRYTSALLAKGPLTVVPDEWVSEVHRIKLDELRTQAVNHRNTRENELGDN